MTLDNEEAEIIVGRKIPFPTTSGLNNLGQPVVSFQREDVAITLKDDAADQQLQLRDAGARGRGTRGRGERAEPSVTAAGGGFITSQRRLQTVALVRDNQTMVIGGLVGSTEGTSESKVPILGDIPLIGNAVPLADVKTTRKTNLMIFLTPHIIDGARRRHD